MIARASPGPRMSMATLHNGVLYSAGQVADDPKAPIEVQTQQVLAKISTLLAEAGSGVDRILSASIWLADMGDFAAMNEVWDAWVPQEAAPARATVQSALATPDYKIEIAVIAALAG